MLRRCRLPIPQATPDACGAVRGITFEYAIFSRSLSTYFFLVLRVDVCFGNDRSTPSSAAKAPFTVDELRLQELVKLLVKCFIPSNWMFSDL